MNIDPQMEKQMLATMLQPWYQAIENPVRAQEEVLHCLLNDYAQSEYGRQHGAQHICHECLRI